jgi:peroxiredoxin Q/BCP
MSLMHQLEGKLAPVINLGAHDGKLFSLEGQRGHWVILCFFSKDATPCCRNEKIALRDKLNYAASLGVVVVGVTIDRTAAHKEFVQQYRVQYPLLHDPEAKNAQNYAVLSQKEVRGRSFRSVARTAFIIDPTGMIKRVLPDFDIEHDLLRALSLTV